MKEQIFLDPNLFEFLILRGCSFDHCLEKLSEIQVCTFVSDVKALQEIVYRYHLMGETAVGYEKANALRHRIDILDITEKDIEIQESLLERYPNVQPRELLHTAVMIHHDIGKIACSPQSSYGQIEDIAVENISSRLCHL